MWYEEKRKITSVIFLLHSIIYSLSENRAKRADEKAKESKRKIDHVIFALPSVAGQRSEYSVENRKAVKINLKPFVGIYHS